MEQSAMQPNGVGVNGEEAGGGSHLRGGFLARAGNVEATGKRKPFIPYLEVEMD